MEKATLRFKPLTTTYPISFLHPSLAGSSINVRRISAPLKILLEVSTACSYKNMVSMEHENPFSVYMMDQRVPWQLYNLPSSVPLN